MTNKLELQVLRTSILGILNQGKQSISLNTGSCEYRGKNGIKCSIGFLIHDDIFHPRLENKKPDDEDIVDALKQSAELDGIDPEVYSKDFVIDLCKLQGIHDSCYDSKADNESENAKFMKSFKCSIRRDDRYASILNEWEKTQLVGAQ